MRIMGSCVRHQGGGLSTKVNVLVKGEGLLRPAVINADVVLAVLTSASMTCEAAIVVPPAARASLERAVHHVIRTSWGAANACINIQVRSAAL